MAVSGLNADAKCQLRNRKIGFIFQAFNLVPVLDVFENVELPILLHSLDEKLRRERVEHMLESVGLKDFAHHR